MEKLSYKLETFEGPLDLLLYLITKNKLDICDIQISELLDQYMEQINAMQEADMDVSSEFLEMAARLVYMKTVSLLPKHEEMEALRQELTGQLLEYQECKKVAAQLAERFSYNIYVRRGVESALHRPPRNRFLGSSRTGLCRSLPRLSMCCAGYGK